jgi:hypothetical protein
VPGSSNFSSSARHQAQTILSKPPYKTTPSHTPRPLAGVIHALGRALNAVLGRPSRWLYHHLLLQVGHGFRSAFGGWWVVVLGVIAVTLGVMAGVLIVRRRTRISARQPESRSIDGGPDDPTEIERQAAAAESAGDYETAVRLRFRAGLLRLQGRGIIVDPGAQTDRQLAATLRSEIFDSLAGRHEMIVYARDPANPTDAETARTEWPRVLVEARPAGADHAKSGPR